MNALKTGIHAKSQIIPGEDPAELDQLTANYYSEIQPQFQYECDLVDSMISHAWELRRLRKAATEIWDDAMEYTYKMQREFAKRNEQPKHLYGKGYTEKIDRCHNRIAAVERAFRASLETLVKLRKPGISLPPVQPEAAQPNDRTNPVAEESQPLKLSPPPEQPSVAPSARLAVPLRTPDEPKNAPPNDFPGNERIPI